MKTYFVLFLIVLACFAAIVWAEEQKEIYPAMNMADYLPYTDAKTMESLKMGEEVCLNWDGCFAGPPYDATHFLKPATTNTPIVLAKENPSSLKGVATFSLGDATGLGYKFPDTAVALGLEKNTRRLFLRMMGDVSLTDKFRYGNVTNVGFTGQVFVKLGEAMLVGGGVRGGAISFSDYGKTYYRLAPTLGLGGKWQVREEDSVRLIISCVLPGHDVRYHLYGYSWDWNYDWQIKNSGKFLRLGGYIGWYWFYPKSNPSMRFNGKGSMGLTAGFVF